MGEGGFCQNLPVYTVLTVYLQCWFLVVNKYITMEQKIIILGELKLGWEVYKNISKSLYYDHKFSIKLKLLPLAPQKVTFKQGFLPTNFHLKQASSSLSFLSYLFLHYFDP